MYFHGVGKSTGQFRWARQVSRLAKLVILNVQSRCMETSFFFAFFFHTAVWDTLLTPREVKGLCRYALSDRRLNGRGTPDTGRKVICKQKSDFPEYSSRGPTIAVDKTRKTVGIGMSSLLLFLASWHFPVHVP